MPKLNDNFKWESATILLLILSSIAIYLNSIAGEFVFDDNHFIINNMWIRDLKHIPKILFSPVFASLPEDQISKADPNFYRPGFHLFLMLGYALSELKPWGYHIVNIIIHAGNVVLLYLISKPLINKISNDININGTPEYEKRLITLLPALIFALHPLHAENVAFISGINVLGLALFYLLSFYLYTRERIILSSIAFFFAMLTKETAITLPILLFVYDLKINRKPLMPIGTWIKRLGPFAITFIVYFAIRLYSLGAMVPTESKRILTPFLYIINLLPLIGKILRKLIFPYDLAFYVYDMRAPLDSLLDIRAILLLILLCVLSITVIKLRRKRPALFLCALWITLPLIPVMFFGWVQGAPVYADRFLYIPCAGFSILVGLLVSMAIKKINAGGKTNYNYIKIAIALFMVAVLGIFSFWTVKRNIIWRTQLTLIADTLERSPNYGLFRFLYARELSKRGMIDEAISETRIALAADNSSAILHNNLGVLFSKKNLFNKAKAEFEIAVKLRPEYEMARKNLKKARMILEQNPAYPANTRPVPTR